MNHALDSTVTLLVSIAFLVTSAKSACTSVNPKNQNVYLGWPVILNCEEAYDYDTFYDYDDDGDYGAVLTCTMIDKSTNETLFNQTFEDDDFFDMKHEIPTVTVSTSSEIEIKIQEAGGIVCSVQTVRLVTVELPDYTCQTSPKDTNNLVESETTQGSPRKFSCHILDKSDEPQLNMDSYTVTWYYNCGTQLPSGVNITTDGKLLSFASADYRHHVGLYSCSIEQNGQTRFIVHYSVCIKPERWSPLVSIHCQESTIAVDKGADVTITCDVDIGSGGDNSLGHSMRFYPLLSNGSLDESKDNISCTSLLGDEAETAPDDRVSCIFSYQRNASAQNFKCFNYTPTDSEWRTEKEKKLTKLVMTYDIKKIKDEEFVTFEALVKNEESGLSMNDTVLVEELQHPDFKAAIIGGVIGSIVFLMIVALVCFIFRLRIHYWWRKHCGPYAKDIHEYGVYLAYSWSDNLEDQEENRICRSLIDKMTKLLPRIGCPVYDPNRNPAVYQFDLRNIQEVQRKCDRIIVVLTSAFLKDEDNDFNIVANFLESPFVFIKTPESDKTLNNLKGKDEIRKNTIKMALKRNCVINWSGRTEKLSQNFLMKLELAMPKRRNTGDVLYENGHAHARV